MSDLIDTATFAGSIRKKHLGVYDDVSDEVLAGAYLEKYPVYKERLKFKDIGSNPATTLRDDAAAWGLRITSARRTPVHNAEVGGSPTSNHLRGSALDIAGDPKKMKEFFHQLRSTYGPDAFKELLFEGNHVHVAWQVPNGQQLSRKQIGQKQSKPGDRLAEMKAGAEAVETPSVALPVTISSAVKAGIKGLTGFDIGNVKKSLTHILEESQPGQAYETGKRILHGDIKGAYETAPGIFIPGYQTLKGLGKAQYDELRQAYEAVRKGDKGEAFWRLYTGLTPIAGPQMAAIDEAIKAKDWNRAIESTVALAGTVLGAKAAAGKGLFKLPKGLPERIPTEGPTTLPRGESWRNPMPETVMEHEQTVTEKPTEVPVAREKKLAPGRIIKEAGKSERAAEYEQGKVRPANIVSRETLKTPVRETPLVDKVKPAEPDYGRPIGTEKKLGRNKPELDPEKPRIGPVKYEPRKTKAANFQPGPLREQGYKVTDSVGRPVADPNPALPAPGGDIVKDPFDESFWKGESGELRPGELYENLQKSGKKVGEWLKGMIDDYEGNPLYATLRHPEIDRLIKTGEDPEKLQALLASAVDGNFTGLARELGTTEGITRQQRPSFWKDETAQLNVGNIGKGMTRTQGLGAEFRSSDRVLKSYPASAPIAEIATRAADEKGVWAGTIERRLADPIRQNLGSLPAVLRRKALFDIGEILDRFPDPSRATGYDSRAIRAATEIRTVLDDIWKQAGMVQPLGRISAYLPHIEQALGSNADLLAGVRQIAEYHLKGKGIGEAFKKWRTPEDLSGKPGGAIVDTVGRPTSRFAKTRTGKTTPIEYDPRRVLPAYVESMAKLIFDKPAVEKMKAAIERIPDYDPVAREPIKLREYAERYVRHYSRYDAYPGLEASWNDVTGAIARTTGRSMTGLYPGLQTLHAGRIPLLWAQMSKDIPTLRSGLKSSTAHPIQTLLKSPDAYFMRGVLETIAHPIESYHEVARLGMLPQELRPELFRQSMAKVDELIHFKSGVDFLDRSIGYHGYRRYFLDQGLSPKEATLRAIAKSKEASAFVDSARPMGFAMEGSPLGTATPGGRLVAQFKHQPAKQAEMVAALLRHPLANTEAFTKGALAVGSLLALQEATGLRVWHLGPGMLTLGGAVFSVVASVGKKLTKGDIEGALVDLLEWVTPGGYAVKRGAETLFGALEKEKKKSVGPARAPGPPR